MQCANALGFTSTSDNFHYMLKSIKKLTSLLVNTVGSWHQLLVAVISTLPSRLSIDISLQ